MTPHAKLAKTVAESFVKNRALPTLPSQVPLELSRQRACYVYLHAKIGRRLRTMHGEVVPRRSSLAEEIAHHTITALQSKTGSVHRIDLASLNYTVAVLEPLQRISDPWQLNPPHDGLYIRSDQNKEAAILPDRAGIDTTDDLLATAIRESGINPREEVVSMYRFNVTYYE